MRAQNEGEGQGRGLACMRPRNQSNRAAVRTAVIIHREQIDNKCHMGRDILACHASYYLTSI